jgi:acyl-CoA synthetase (AMP-forming)/AMP-acid ligase II
MLETSDGLIFIDAGRATPAAVVVVPALEKTAAGKIVMGPLREKYAHLFPRAPG